MNLDPSRTSIPCLDEEQILADHLEPAVVGVAFRQRGGHVNPGLKAAGGGTPVDLNASAAGVVGLDERQIRPSVAIDVLDLEPAVVLVAGSEPGHAVLAVLVAGGDRGRVDLDSSRTGIPGLDKEQILPDHLEVAVVLVAGSEPGHAVLAVLVAGGDRGRVDLDSSRTGIPGLDKEQIGGGGDVLEVDVAGD